MADMRAHIKVSTWLYFLQPVEVWFLFGWQKCVIHKMEVVGNVCEPVPRDSASNGRIM